MVKRKFLSSLLFLGIITIGSFQSLKASANAGMDFGEGFNAYTTDYRPTEGYINAGAWYKNPEFPSNNNWETYSRKKTRVISQKIQKYGYDVYYYLPVTYANYTDAVPENAYANWYWDTAWRAKNTYNDTKFNNSKHSITPNKYRDIKTEQAWRYLGYNLLGQAVENPYFRPDALYSDQNDLGSSRLVSGNIHGRYTATNSKAYNYVIKGSFDADRMYVKKVNAVKRLMNVDSSLNSGKINYQHTNNTIYNWALSSNADTRAQQWAEVLALTSNPDVESPIFRGWNNAGYYTSAVAPASEIITKTADLSVVSITVKDGSGIIVGYGWRSADGNWNQECYQNIYPNMQYFFEYKVHNYGNRASIVNPTQIISGFSINDNSLKNGEANKFPENDSSKNKNLNQSVVVSANSAITFSRIETAPSNLRTGWKPSAYISDTHKNTDNSNVANDTGFVRLNKIALSDVSAENIKFIDINGNETSKVIPGEKYKVKFFFKYTGASYYANRTIKNEKGETITISDSPVNMTFTGKVERFYPQEKGTSDTKTYTFNENGMYPKNGDIYTFISPDYFVVEQPKLNVNASVKTSDSAFNSNPDNDNYQFNYNDSYDYSVSNVKVIPSEESPLKDGTIKVGIVYDITVKAPSHVSKEFDLTTQIQLPDGTKTTVTDHVKTGSNTNIVHEVNVKVSKLTSGSETKILNVAVNSDQKKWEDDLATQANNKGQANFVVKAPLNPTDFPNGNGCPIGSTDTNEWNVNHSVSSVYGTKVTYSKFQTSTSFGFYNYNHNSATTQSKKYSESYKIDKVLFKSKFTTDNNYGSNGWVDLTKASEKDKAKIKAGYGYELQIDVSYKNNVFSNQPTASINRGTTVASGTTVSNLQIPANINNDIYVRTADGKTLSATGMYGTVQAFTSTVLKNTNEEVQIRYAMKTKTTNGVSEPLKIFVGENLKDGTYGLNVFTPVMNGIGSTVSKSKLCDFQKLSFKVQGSMYDDNSDHIVQ